MSWAGFIVGALIVLALKYIIKGKLIEGLTGMIAGDNKILNLVIHFLAPGIFALVFLIIAYFVNGFCPQVAIFLVVCAVIIGGLLGLVFVQFMAAFPVIGPILGPMVAPIQAVFFILLIIFIVELILPIVLPGLGSILSLIIGLVAIAVLSAYAGNILEILTCAPQITSSGEGPLGILLGKFGLILGV